MSEQPLVPPFTRETAESNSNVAFKKTTLEKVKKAQALWNTKNPEKVVLAYTEDSIWRNRDLFLRGHDQIKEFLVKKWQKEKQYKLRKELFAFTDNKIAVQFWYEYYDENKKAWFRCYGLEAWNSETKLLALSGLPEDWTFESDGRMRKRQMSGNEIEINDDQRWYKGKSSDEEYDQVEITEEHW
ncbi:hypothetical protein Clacol_003856 [Clathrus columnatus]|uniref:DUF1348-domain-containing protein n=1 Tax=Clathrus columnatus TaxID=1419009 RepID=A0AAV5A4W6_9AGAM|nr:hypothetical protein Clacol_003856 [Clathrus columnatus]